MNDFEKILIKISNETGISKKKAIVYYELFYNSYIQAQDMIRKSLLEEDKTYLLKTLHQLRGSAANLRLESISGMISLMEKDVKELNFIKCKENFDASINIINEIKKQMDEYKDCNNEKSVDC